MTSTRNILRKYKASTRPIFSISPISIFMIVLLFFFFASSESQLSAAESPATLLEALKQRNSEIDVREKKVIEREGRLNLLEKEVRGMLDEYIKLKEIVDQREAEHASALRKETEARTSRLSKIYQAMDPKEAADRIKKMKKSTALSLLRKIKEKQAAKILSSMNAATATQFSEAFIRPEK